MRWILLVLVMLVVAVNAWGYDDFCRMKEYAELKDMDKEELILEFKDIADKYNKSVLLEKETPTHDSKSAELKLHYSDLMVKCYDRLSDYTKQLKKRYKYSPKQIDNLFKSYVVDPRTGKLK